jgi:F-type H+-transporting ATPase subunit delta
MLNLSKAKYYAQALFGVGQEEKKIDQFLDNLIKIQAIFKIKKEIKDYFLSPEIKFVEKEKSLKNLLGNSIEKEIYNFILELIKKKELNLLEFITERLKVLVYQSNKIIEAEVISAIELSNNDKQNILKKIEEKTGKKVKLETKVDQDVLGGMKIKIGDEMVDLSVRGRLEALRQEIIN